MRKSVILPSLFCCSPAALAAAEPAGVDVSSLVRLIVGLLAVIVAILVLAWLMRRMGSIGGHGGGQLRVLGGLAVGQRERVGLIQVGDKQLLIGVAPGRVQTLHVLEEPLAEDGIGSGTRPAPGGNSFAERLRRVMQQSEGKR